MKKKNLCLLISCMVMAIGATACGKNPDSSIVKNKDFDKMIEEAEKKEGGDNNVKDVAPDYDTYKNSFHDDKLGVSVDVDAAVDIPKTDKMSVLRVRQKDINQKFIDTFLDNYVKDVKLYDGSITGIKTKSDVEKDISETKELMKSCTEDEKTEYQLELEQLQKEYELSPTNLKWDDYVSDKKLHQVEELMKKRNNSIYQWMQECNPKGDVFYAVNDGKAGEYISMYAQNSDDYGNCFKYRRNKHGYEFTASQAVVSTPLQNIEYEDEYTTNRVWKAENDIPINAFGGRNISEYKDERATISQEEAKNKAKELMTNMGLDEFDLYDCGLYSEVPDIRNQKEEEEGYWTVYIIRFKRKVDGVFVIGGGEKYSDSHTSSGFEKKIWSSEIVEIRVNDNGIVGFDYNSPIEIVETVVDKSNMKKFEEMKKTFEKMSVITHANDNTNGGTLYTNIEVKRVILGYVMISEENNFDTGLLVPGWDFVGLTIPGYMEDNQFLPMKEKEYGSVLTINAIDGTVIDKTLGY